MDLASPAVSGTSVYANALKALKFTYVYALSKGTTDCHAEVYTSG